MQNDLSCLLIINLILMKISNIIILLAAIVCISCDTQKVAVNNDEKAYNPQLAQEVGADEYGMKSYVIAFLKSGPNRPTDQQKSAELQAAHLANIKRMAQEGSLIVAGPFLDDGDIRGIYIFNVTTTEEAEVLTATDPAIKAGSLVMELHPWYGSAGLMKVPELHLQVAKTQF
jgi:uncharacterized protein YciI